MTSGWTPNEGILAEGGLRHLRNETGDTPESDSSGTKVKRVVVSSDTGQGRSIFLVGTSTASATAVVGHGGGWVEVIPAERATTFVAENEYLTQSIIYGPNRGWGDLLARASDYVSARATAHADTGLISRTSDWLEDVVREINALPIVEQTKKDATEVARFCAQMPVEEPLIDVDEHGSIELFFRSGPSGVLLVVAATRNLQLFGNENGEKWRAQYGLDGQIWRRELPGAMKAVTLR